MQSIAQNFYVDINQLTQSKWINDLLTDMPAGRISFCPCLSGPAVRAPVSTAIVYFCWALTDWADFGRRNYEGILLVSVRLPLSLDSVAENQNLRTWIARK